MISIFFFSSYGYRVAVQVISSDHLRGVCMAFIRGDGNNQIARRVAAHSFRVVMAIALRCGLKEGRFF